MGIEAFLHRLKILPEEMVEFQKQAESELCDMGKELVEKYRKTHHEIEKIEDAVPYFNDEEKEWYQECRQCLEPISLRHIKLPQLLMVKANPEYLRRAKEGGYESALKPNEHYLVLGEIAQAPGHIAVVNRDGRVLWMYHPEYFIVLKSDEV